jgi:hypothetical protein
MLQVGRLGKNKLTLLLLHDTVAWLHVLMTGCMVGCHESVCAYPCCSKNRLGCMRACFACPIAIPQYLKALLTSAVLYAVGSSPECEKRTQLMVLLCPDKLLT